MTTSIFPKNMLTDLTRAFMAPSDPKAMNDRFRTQAYVMASAANRDKNLASADYYKQKTAEQETRNKARTPEAMETAALAGMGMSPQAPQAMDLAEAFRTGRNPVTPGQPAVELPAFDNSQIGNFDLASVMGNPNISLETLAPATQPVERPVDPAQLSDLAQRMGDFMGMQAATGDTNYQQLQAGAGQRMENAILQKAVSGQPLTPQDMAILKASALYDNSGGRYTGENSDFTTGVESGRMQRERIQSSDRRYGADASEAASRYRTDVGAATSRANAALKGDEAAPDDMEAINSVDLSIPFKRQVPLTNPRYDKFARLYNALKDTDQLGARKLRYYAQQEGLIQDSLED